MLWQVFIITLLCVTGNCKKEPRGCDKSFSATKDKDKDAKIQLEATMSYNESEVTVYIEQRLPKDYEIKKSGIKIVVKNVAKLESLKAYITETENCSMWSLEKEDIDISSFVSERMANGSYPLLKENVTTLAKENATYSDEDNDMMNIGNLFDLVGRNVIIIDGDDNKQCGKLEIEDTEGLEMLTMKFLKSMEYSEDALIEIIAKRTCLPVDGIEVLNVDDEEDCAVVEVYFNIKLNNTILKKLYMLFTSKYELGIYSPTEKCMTNIKETFISEMVMDRFLNGDFDDEDKKEPTQICSSVGLQIQIEEYEARVRRYDRAMADWIEKYGSANLQYDERMRTNNKYEGRDYSEGDDENRRRLPYSTERGNNGDVADYSKSDSAIQLKMLLRYLGMNEGRDLTEQRRKLNLITQKRGVKTTDDYNEMQMILQKIRNLGDKQDEVERMTKYGLCLLSNMDSGFEKLQEIKMRLEKAVNWEDEADTILKKLILDVLSQKIEKITSKEVVLFDDKKDLYKTLTTMKVKLQMIFRVDANCSTEEERYRVGKAIEDLQYIVPKMLEPYLREFEDIDDIKKFLVTMNVTFTEDFEKTSKNLWVLMYTPDFMPMDNSSFSPLSMLNALSVESRSKLFEKFMVDIKTVSVENLMKLQTFMKTDEEIMMKCSLKALATQILDLGSENEESPCDGDSESEYAETDYEDNYKEYNYRRGANYRRDNGYRTNDYYRKDDNYRVGASYRRDDEYRSNAYDRTDDGYRRTTIRPYEKERALPRTTPRTTTRMPYSTQRGRESDYDRPSPNREYDLGRNTYYRATREQNLYPRRLRYDDQFYENPKPDYDGEYKENEW